MPAPAFWSPPSRAGAIPGAGKGADGAPERVWDSLRNFRLVSPGGFRTVSRLACAPHPHPDYEAPLRPRDRAPLFHPWGSPLHMSGQLPFWLCSPGGLRPEPQGLVPGSDWLASGPVGRACPGGYKAVRTPQTAPAGPPKLWSSRSRLANSSPANQRAAGAMAGEYPAAELRPQPSLVCRRRRDLGSEFPS